MSRFLSARISGARDPSYTFNRPQTLL